MWACTLHEPYVWAFIHSNKRIENREYMPSSKDFKTGPAPVHLKRGEVVALHAGKTYDEDGALSMGWMLESEGLVVPDKESLSLGCVMAVAQFYGVTKAIPTGSSQERWRSVTEYAWVFDEVWKLPTPVPAVGRQRLWRLPESVHEDVVHQWGKAEKPCSSPKRISPG